MRFVYNVNNLQNDGLESIQDELIKVNAFKSMIQLVLCVHKLSI